MFAYSICEPFFPDVIEKGRISPAEFWVVFEEFPWQKRLEEIAEQGQEKSFYSPSLELRDEEKKQAVVVSVVGKPGDSEFYIFYKYPRRVSYLWGLFKQLEPDYVSSYTGQSLQDAKAAFQALLDGDETTLQARWG